MLKILGGRVDVFDSKEDYQDSFDETLKVDKCLK